MENIYMGTAPTNWMSTKRIKHITFNITDDCNLACTYCYFVNKSSHNKMNFETAKKAIDYILSESRFDIYDGVVWDFIGGEPTLELKLIDEICDYIICSMYDHKHKWLYCYKFMIGTNGLLYSTPAMQKLINKHKLNIHIAVTVDGSKEKHDLSRKQKDGAGSYDVVVKQVPLWLKQTGNYSTKSTFAHADLPYLKDSIISLWNIGITNVMANVVFEDCWEEGDEIIFEQQLKLLADYVIDNKLWNMYSVRFFDPDIGHPLSIYAEKHNFCGAKNMLTISTKGEIFPCIRFMESALIGKPGRLIGEVDGGIQSDLLRPFFALDVISQSSDECINCEVASGCSWCSGNNYCYSNNETIFDRKTYNCKMHKANVRAAEYFWKNFEKTTGQVSPMRRLRIENVTKRQKYLYILLDNTTGSFCQYKKASNIDSKIFMDAEMIKKAIDFCDKNRYVPIFVGKNASDYLQYGLTISEDSICRSDNSSLLLNRESAFNLKQIINSSLILSLSRTDILDLETLINHICTITNDNTNIDIFFEDLLDFTEDDLLLYKKQVDLVSKNIVNQWKNGPRININIITHGIYKDYSGSCNSGLNKATLGPDGRFYLCPAFYYDDLLRDKYVIGDLNKGIINNFTHLCNYNKNIGCRECGATHCNHCIYLSIKSTREFCVAPEIICVKSNIERMQMVKFYNEVKDLVAGKTPLLNDNMDTRDYYDPLKLLNSDILNKFNME